MTDLCGPLTSRSYRIGPEENFKKAYLSFMEKLETIRFDDA